MVSDQASQAPLIHDIIIIGAGPAGLAVAARLCEQTPSALFTDEEHQRYHWIRKHGQAMSIKNRKTGKVKQAATADVHAKAQGYSTLVLDAAGDEWMARWNRLFHIFDIKHLRSPMWFHVDPSDRDALLAYTYEKGRVQECAEIKGCVGKEISKHAMRKRAKLKKQ
jgi:2-polyprenyl-6-methoxyphenol hydroxylase-like FAD-dependent oxidoreductase